MTPLPLISAVDSVPRDRQKDWWDKHRNVAIVHIAPDGTLTVATGTTPRFWEKVLGKAGTRLAVDVSDHRRQAAVRSTPLPCSDGAYRFEASIDIGFRVHDPKEVVRRNIPDALPVVYGHVVHLIRTTARRFPIDQAAAAEDEVNKALAHGVSLPEGITVYVCRVHIEPDDEAREYVKQLTRARRQAVLGQKQHEGVIARARSEEAVADLRQDGELAREKQRADALAGMSWDVEGLIQRHLVKHPEDTDRALQLRIEWESTQAARWELGTQRSDEMFRFMVEKDFFRAPDLAAMYGGGALGPYPPPVGLPPGHGAGTSGPVPTAPVLWGGSAGTAGSHPGPAQGTAQGTAQGGAGGGPAAAMVMPVYLVFDASQGAAAHAAGLNDALRSLHTLLTQSPDVSAGLRLSVLGFAERPDMRLPLTRVDWGTDVPHLSPGGGLNLAAAFDGLLDLLPGDVDRLKHGGGRVQRPVVVMVLTAPPQDGTQWPEAQQRLAAHRYAPTILACGLGDAEARTVLRIASAPSLAFVAAPGLHPAEQAPRFSALLQNTLLHLGRGVLAGHAELVAECPQGLLPAASAQ